MLNLFPKKPKVKPGKTTQLQQAAQTRQKQGPLGGLAGAFHKLNSMDRKQAYTFGAIGVVLLVGLLMLGTASSSEQEDFANFETRGYDLANMPFSSDEAEQFLLASKYPDMQHVEASGLYTAADKAERQEEDAEEAGAVLDTSATAAGSEYMPGRYYGGGGAGAGRGGSGARTQVGNLNSASLKGASGSGISGTFGPSGDFSNFRSQNKGSDKFTPQTAGSGNARKALFQSAMASRAAAGQKDNKLINAKKAMMGGNVAGSKAFMDDSGAVNLGEAKGLNLDTNAPVSSADLSGLDDGLQNAKDNAEKKAEEKEEREWWQEMLIDMAKSLAQGLVQMGNNSLSSAVQAAQAGKAGEAAMTAEIYADWNEQSLSALNESMKGTVTSVEGDLMTTVQTTTGTGGDTFRTTTVTSLTTGELVSTSEVNLSELAGKSIEVPRTGAGTKKVIEQMYLANGRFKGTKLADDISFDAQGYVYNRGERIGLMTEDGQYVGNNARFHKNAINSEQKKNVAQQNSFAITQAGNAARGQARAVAQQQSLNNSQSTATQRTITVNGVNEPVKSVNGNTAVLANGKTVNFDGTKWNY